jgi:signal transduction histidine kinase
LRTVLVLFFLALAIPTVILIMQASAQMKWEAFHQQRLLAEELVSRIDQRYSDMIETENARPFTDYSFLNVIADPNTNVLQRSPLSMYPLKSSIPGVIGYFQIDSEGRFSTPLLPDSGVPGITADLPQDEYQKRQQLSIKIYHTLSENKLVGKLKTAENKDIHSDSRERQKQQTDLTDKRKLESSVYEKPRPWQQETDSQAGFDMLQEQRLAPQASGKTYSSSLGRVEDLKLKKNYEAKTVESENREQQAGSESSKVKRILRKERNVLPSRQSTAEIAADAPVLTDDFRINIFESEIDSLEFSMLDSGHFVLFRKVWRNGRRDIQGLLIDSSPFISGVIGKTFDETVVSYASDLVVAYRGDVLSVLRAKDSGRYLSSSNELQGTLLLQERLGSTLDQLELIFSVNILPAGPGGVIVSWLSLIILLVLCGGFLLIYRLGLKQINLARQQQDFVSAVSHELKTPLTSIRMYGEMLREGWASEEKRKTYYDYIYDESERLTRLINNVLHLARMTRNDINFELKSCSVAELLDIVKSKIQSQVDGSGFVLNSDYEDSVARARVDVDIDYFTQIFINLVDNAIKFSANSEKKQIDIGCRFTGDDNVQFYVRDYGPGIARDQMRKIFRLFYRSENELTRETLGTGIGLALVNQLIQSMNGSVDVINREPGSEFRLQLKVK